MSINVAMTPISIAVSGQALLHDALDLTVHGADAVRTLIRDADAAFVNLEASIETEGAWPTKTKALHLTTPAGVASLRDLGFDALTHANNHAFDLGPPGIERTRSVVEKTGMKLVGSGSCLQRAAEPAIIQTRTGLVAVLSVDLGPQPDIVYASESRPGINPLRVRRKVSVPRQHYDVLKTLVAKLGDDKREAARAAIGYRGSVPDQEGYLEVFGMKVFEGQKIEAQFEADPADWASFESTLAAARVRADIVAIALHNHHWDPDWGRTPSWVTELSHRLIEHGADLIVGTGSPVLQGISFHRGKPILAGLGNLIFHTRRIETYDRQGVDVWTGAVCRCAFDKRASDVAKVEILPIAVGRSQSRENERAPAPTPLREADAKRVLDFMTAGLSNENRARVVLVQT